MFKRCNEKKVRCSSDFRGLRELKMGPVVRHQIAQKALSNEQLVKIGRDHYHKGMKRNSVYRSWADTLTLALDRAGYIRHDISERTFLVGRMYRRMYTLVGKDCSKIATDYKDLDTNARYESCQYITDDWYYHMIRFIEKNLTEQEQILLKLKFGLHDGVTLSEGEIGRIYGLLSPVVRHEIRNALIRLDKAGIPALDY